jgi:hypothetical protein
VPSRESVGSRITLSRLVYNLYIRKLPKELSLPYLTFTKLPRLSEVLYVLVVCNYYKLL